MRQLHPIMHPNMLFKSSVCIVTSTSMFCAIFGALPPGYCLSIVADSDSGLSPYYGRRRPAKSMVPPAPVNAVINSGLDSAGAQFLLPFEGRIGRLSNSPVGAGGGGADNNGNYGISRGINSNNSNNNGINSNNSNDYSSPTMASRVVPTDLDYGNYDAQDSDTAVLGATMFGTPTRQLALMPINGARLDVYGSQGEDNYTSGGTGQDLLHAGQGPQFTVQNSWPGRAGAAADLDNKHGKHKGPLKLFGSVSREDQFGVRIDDLLACALVRNTKMKDIDRQVAHFHSRPSKSFDGFKDSINEMVEYKGASRSMEAADVILDKNVKAQSAESSDYIKQRYVDQLHPRIVTKVMEIAMGMGLADQARGKEMVESGLKELREIVGNKQAKNTVAMMQDWAENLKIPAEIFNQRTWDVESYRNKVNLATKIAMNSDPVINDIIKSIRRFHRSKLSNAAYSASQVVGNLAEVAAPGILIPVGIETVRVGVMQANGGSEPKKLLKELYYDKRIESRYRTINEESQLAITNYQLALANHNAALLACTESVLSQLVGPECIVDVLDKSIFHPRNHDNNDVNNPHTLEAAVSGVVVK